MSKATKKHERIVVVNSVKASRAVEPQRTYVCPACGKQLQRWKVNGRWRQTLPSLCAVSGKVERIRLQKEASK